MPAPEAIDGVFEGGILFDGRGYRDSTDIINYTFRIGRLGIVRKKHGYFSAEFLELHKSPTFSLPVWDFKRDPTLCATEEEAKLLIDDFVSQT